MTLTRSTATPPANGKTSQVLLTTGVTITNVPAALTELAGATTTRQRMDLTGVGYARLSANVATLAAATEIRVQYSIDGGSTFAYLDGGTGPAVSLAATGTVVSKWVKVAAAAQGDVLLRVVTIGGDGALDPVVGTVALQIASA